MNVLHPEKDKHKFARVTRTQKKSRWENALRAKETNIEPEREVHFRNTKRIRHANRRGHDKNQQFHNVCAFKYSSISGSDTNRNSTSGSISERQRRSRSHPSRG